MFVDYAGTKLQVIDWTTGEILTAELFVAVLGASNFTYAEATWTQSLPDWIGAHKRAFRYFGGVTAIIVSDYVPGHVTQRVLCPAGRLRTVRCGYAADPRRWAKNVLDGTGRTVPQGS